jgi:CBS domain-containing protein
MQAKVNSRETAGSSEKMFNYNLSWEKGNVVSVSPRATLKEAVKLMKDQQVGDVLVIDQEAGRESLQGIITDRDIALCLAEDVDFQDLKVSDIMSTSVVTASQEDDFFKLVSLMNQQGVTRLPLLDNKGHVVGVVTAKNLLELLVKSLFEVTQISEQQQENERNQQQH